MTRHIIATALATALAYLIGAFIAWDLAWPAHMAAKDRADVIIPWLVLVVGGNLFAILAAI